MKPIEEMEFHPISEEITKILCDKTQNPNPLFFRVSIAYYFAVVASMMRAQVATHDRGVIPINIYALNLGTSGSGKGYSTNIMEEQVINGFRDRFMSETFPAIVERNLPQLAFDRAQRKNANPNPNAPLADPDAELEKVRREFAASGTILFSFDSGTTPALKQFRHLLQMAKAGAMNLQIDEIGSNLLANTELLTAYLEVYDKGKIKTKLIKNTQENTRNEELEGGTPANMLLFGTPAKLLDGAKTEEEFLSMLETGYARRCLFGWSRGGRATNDLTPEEIYEMQTNKASDEYLMALSEHVAGLAHMDHYDKQLTMSKETAVVVIAYKKQCEKLSEELPEYEEVKKMEIDHRYFKALKLAGAYAFIDGSDEVTTDHLYNAIKLVEQSGQAFQAILTRDPSYARLAKFFASCKDEVTHTDLMAKLPFFKGGVGQRQDMLQLAIAYGYRHNIIIKKSFSDGIEFLRGESLKETDLNSMIVSYSTDIATGYLNERVPFEALHELTQAQGYHWVAHHLAGGDKGVGHRLKSNILPGFNLIVLDIDGDVSIDTVKLLLKDYKFHLYTTKSHSEDQHCFRVIMPMNFELNMTDEEYKEFMTNVYSWLPFKVDTQTNQREKKWLSWNMHYEYNDGQVFDALPFIPKTTKNEERKKSLASQTDLDNLQRWMFNNTGDGNRNNMLLRYAMVLADSGKYNFFEVQTMVIEMNDKLPDKLDTSEITTTIMKTVANRMSGK
jgi:hypothetical protein